ncbi:MAG TPA: nitroreductase/quinone reductase family protein [Acidimicrobiales bacterium]|jgi:deazaflavin-dependent oxidoreductase (nitroreductase family)|nr:nitroreductase/quinone reductase family protein [Acidimicrobiales bacterium]
MTKWLARLLVGLAGTYLATAVFERLAPRPWVRAWQRFANPRMLALAGLAPGWAVVETTGRKTGLPRRSPVGGRLRHQTFWLVCAERHHSQYVKNIEADPRVRVKVHGRWRPGTAHLLDHDDPVRRMVRLNPLNHAFISIAGRDHATIRIDLDG